MDESKSSFSSECWEMIDGVVVINLDASTDRLAQFYRNNGAFIPQEKLHRISAICGVDLPGYGEKPWFGEMTGDRASFWAGSAGCVLSHRKAIKYAKQQKWRNVLIMEDDAQLLLNEESASMLAKALKKVSGRYMLYLGYNKPVPVGRKCIQGDSMDVWLVDGVLAAHAYIIPAAMYDVLLKRLPDRQHVWEWLAWHKAVDVLYRDYIALMPRVRVYVFYPVMCTQGSKQSDIGQCPYDAAEMECSRCPNSIFSTRAIGRYWFPVLQQIKSRLNSLRTHRRALKGGLPGFRDRKKN